MSSSTHLGALSRARVLARASAALTTVSTVLSVAGAVVFIPSTSVSAKTPGARYCFARACHRVMTLAQTRAVVGKPTMAVTSFYDDCHRDRYNPCGLTSSGEVFRSGASNTAASPIYPDGTIVVVRNPKNGESAIIRINNAGPYWGNRTLDLSRGAGVKLGLGRVGVAKVEVTVLRAPSRKEATYRKGRRYPALPGHVGQFASLGEAQVYAALQLDLPDVLGSNAIAVAQVDLDTIAVSPVEVDHPARARPQRRRLPAEPMRVASLQPASASGGKVRETSGLVKEQSPGIQQSRKVHTARFRVAHTVEISDALLAPPAGATTRVISPRESIIGSLNAGDFDRRGRSLLVPIAEATEDMNDNTAEPPGSLAAVRAEEHSDSSVAHLTLERMPPLATRGERGWYRRAKAAVSSEVAFAPAAITTPESRVAHWSAMRIAMFNPQKAHQLDNAGAAYGSGIPGRLASLTRTAARARATPVALLSA